jgi:uncharacterized membrane protein
MVNEDKKRKHWLRNMKQRGMGSTFKDFFVTTMLGGVLVLLPIVLFLVVINFVLRIIAGLIGPIALIFSSGDMAPFIANVLAFIIVVLLCFLVGLFIRTRSGRELFIYFDKNYLAQLPFYSTIQQTVQQFFGKKESSFSQVVLIEVFGSLMTGFVTQEHANGLYTVFVPTAPNPTNGFVFHVKKEKIVFTDVKPEDAIRTVIGVGTGSQILFDDLKPAPPPDPQISEEPSPIVLD